jgi:hypothetical protein
MTFSFFLSIFQVKKHFPIVTLDDFRKGVEKATKRMSQDRRRRFAANVDMYGSLPEELVCSLLHCLQKRKIYWAL